MIADNDIYSTLVQLLAHAESTTWNRLYNFLTANSILILAWATIFTSDASINTEVLKKIILLVISIMGGLMGIFWAALGARGRKYVDKYIEIGSYLESDPNCWPSTINQSYKPLTQSKNLRDTIYFKYSGSCYLLTGVPICFSILYAILIIASIWR